MDFYCPHGHLLTADDSQAGQQLQCPMCSATVIAPGGVVEQVLEVDRSPVRARRKATRGGLPRELAWVIAVVVVFGPIVFTVVICAGLTNKVSSPSEEDQVRLKAKELLLARLKHPLDAEFGWGTEVRPAGSGYIVSGTVQVKNDLGATFTKPWRVHFSKDDNVIECDAIVLGKEVLWVFPKVTKAFAEGFAEGLQGK